MDIYNNSNNILSVLDSFVLDNSDDIAMQIEHQVHNRVGVGNKKDGVKKLHAVFPDI